MTSNRKVSVSSVQKAQCLEILRKIFEAIRLKHT